MQVRSAEFIISNTKLNAMPAPDKPEFAFIGRSNVGKSSLINMLAAKNEMARTSSKPGKTQTINHYLINDQWYLVDLPGYGYAGVSKTKRHTWGTMIEDYVLKRSNLYCIFVLIDSRVDPQKNDLDFVQWLGEHQLPLAIIFTKGDKMKQSALARSVQRFKTSLEGTWDELPPSFITSAEKKAGREVVLQFIENAMKKG
jgi:GTP-binding protein